jgi:hypothetical protein
MTIKKKYNEITNHLVIMLEKKKNTILMGEKTLLIITNIQSEITI